MGEVDFKGNGQEIPPHPEIPVLFSQRGVIGGIEGDGEEAAATEGFLVNQVGMFKDVVFWLRFCV